MDDPLKKRLHKIHKYSASVKRRASLYGDLSKIDGKTVASSLGPLNRASAPGRKLQKIGFIIFWIPEPTGVTCAIGAPMVLAGKFLDKKYNGATIKDIGSHTKETIENIHSFKKTVF